MNLISFLKYLPNSKVSIALVYNCPGSGHDAMNAKRGGLEVKLDALPMNIMLVSDTAFSVTHMKLHRILQYPKKDKNLEPRGVDSEIKSVRQCAKCGGSDREVLSGARPFISYQ